jgi:putative hydrolases of HD superfamily
MSGQRISGILEFLRSAEKLKNVTRTSWTSDGHRESVAEHTWRLCLMALVLGREFEGVDMARLMKMCVIHDLGEAIGGDISAKLQSPGSKAAQERADLLELLRPLPHSVRNEIVELWDEYEAAATPEAHVAKALDKLETIMQHNQGRNPADFDYAFNLGYGTQYTADHPLIVEIRRILDEETSSRAAANVAGTPPPPATR